MQHDGQDFYLYKILRAHILPLTNCEFNKAGDKCVAAAFEPMSAAAGNSSHYRIPRADSSLEATIARAVYGKQALVAS